MNEGPKGSRSAAMMQADVQATFDPSVNVLVARPIIINLPNVAHAIIERIGSPRLLLEEFKGMVINQEVIEAEMSSLLSPFSGQAKAAFDAASPNLLSQIMQFIQQLALLDFNISQTDDQKKEEKFIGLSRLASADPAEMDRTLGVCALPLYDFSERQIERLIDSRDVDEISELLTTLGIRQYFFPAADQAILGLAERGASEPPRVIETISKAAEIGHPLGPNEIVPVEARAMDIVEDLQHRGYIATGEIGFEVTEAGRSQRVIIKFQPREGFISKVLNRVNINFDLSDFAKK